MSKLAKAVPTPKAAMDLSQMRGVNPLLEDYLDRLTAPLMGIVSYDVRTALRVETQEHLEIRIEGLERNGMSYPDATREAIRLYGPASRVSDEFLMQWFESSATSPLLRRIGKANGIAFSYFLLAHLIYIVFLQAYVFDPSGAAYAFSISPGELRHFVPEPMPLPDGPGALIATFGYPIVAPIVAGWLVGWQVPVRPYRAVWHSMLPILVYSFIVGTLLLPVRTGVFFALFEAAFWLPVGAGIAYAASCVRRARVGR